MLETELFALFEQTADAAYTVAPDGEICSWSASAQRLFGYSADEVLGRNIDDVLDARDSLGTQALAGGLEAATRQWDGSPHRTANFDLEVRTRAGTRLWVNVSTIVFDNRRTGRRLYVRLARDITQRRRRADLVGSLVDVARQIIALADDTPDHAPVELLSEQERRILRFFAEGSSPSTIVRRLKISPQTLRNHLHHINRKLRTHNRLEAVTHAQRRGLID
jgi:PAS domain S-box-containing protein